MEETEDTDRQKKWHLTPIIMNKQLAHFFSTTEQLYFFSYPECTLQNVIQPNFFSKKP